jgi:hypothetical protein
MIAVPADTAVTDPLVEFIVATPVLSDDHVPPLFPLEDNEVVPLEQIAVVPLIVPAFGAAVTVTVLVAVALVQPPVPTTVYVIVVVPAETPVTSPLTELIVATPVLLEDHDPPTPDVLKVVEPLEQIAVVPLIVPAFG